MAIEDKDFIERQVETAAKGLSKFLDVADIESLFKKKEDDKEENQDDNKTVH